MSLTKNFRETVQARAKSDPAFRRGLLSEAVECLLSGRRSIQDRFFARSVTE
jgi:hypothetical protein